MENEIEKAVADALKTKAAQDRQDRNDDRIEHYRRLNLFARKGQILFAGSSLCEHFPVNELLMDLSLPYTVYNRGVSGYTCPELTEHLDTCILDLEPRHLFINIGTNDLTDPTGTIESVMHQYRKILQTVKENIPGIHLYLLAYYPVNPAAAEGNEWMEKALKIRTNEKIREANKAVENLAGEMGALYIDCNKNLTDPEGCLKKQFTVEGMHMYADGYMEVLKVLLPTLKSITEEVQ